MKKLLLICILALTTYLPAHAQVCTPDTNIKEPGIYPKEMPEAKAGMAYSEVIQFKFPTDTTYQSVTVPIDSVRIDSVTNFPPGFSYQCSNNTCTYPGGSSGCARVTGNPVDSMAGDYTLTVYATAYVKFGNQPFTVPYEEPLDFKVTSSSSGFARKQAAQAFDVKQNMPNPFGMSTRIEYTVPFGQQVTFSVYDVLGKEVYTAVKQARSGSNYIDFQRNGLKGGLYFYSIQAGSQRITKRMMIGQ